MSLTLDNIEPQIVWQEFYGLCKIPRGSGNEKQISYYLKQRFEELGYKVNQDQVGDIHVIREKDEGVKTNVSICLQAHMDMVCSKKAETKHDFLKDPILPRVTEYDGQKVVMATGTTLGADDGAGVATILALFKEGSKTNMHWPRLEALITVNEEQLMTGAMSVADHDTKVDAPIVNPEGKPIRLSNSEDIKIITTSSAGGANFEFTFDFKSEKVQLKDNETEFYLAVKGGTGGHSGVDANKYIANTIKQLARILSSVQKYNYKCCHMCGGTAHNAIPMDCEFSGIIEKSKFQEFKKEVEQLGEEIKSEYKVTDPHMIVICEERQDKELQCLSVEDTQRFIDFVSLIPVGVFRVSQETKGLTETSGSLGVVRLTAGQVGQGLYLARSCINSELPNIEKQLGQLCKAFNIGYSGAKDAYLGWFTSPNDEFIHISRKCYAQACNCPEEEIKIDAIHAGLECGQLMANNKCFQAAASIGPTVLYPHSDREQCIIDTVKPFYQCVKNILDEYSKKQ